MTLKEYIQSLPKERVQLAATDLNEATKIEQEHAALPGAIFDTADQIDGKSQANPAAGAADNTEENATQQPAAPAQSFDLTNDDDVKGFIKGMELSHPELVNRLRRDERAWDDMLSLDSNYTSRIQRDGQIKFTGDDKADYDFFRWAYGRGMLQSDTSIGGLASAFGRGLWQMAKGAAKLGATAAKSAANPAAAMELGATTVDAAQAAVAEYQQLGAGLAALTSGDNPQVKMAAMYELAKFADTEQKNHNAWRKAINDSFAEVPVDEDSVEFLSEAFDISNLIGAGAGKVVTTGLKRAGAAGAAEMLGKSRKALGSEMLAEGLSKVPVIGTPYKRAILVGQADLLSEEAQIAYKSVAEAQADLAAKRATLAAAPAADPKDVLLKQVSEAEADLARKQAAFDAVNTKLNTVRQGVSDALDLEGRGLLDRAAAGAVEGTGVAVRGTGRAMTRAYRGLSELLTGEADNAAFDIAAGQVAGNLANKGNIVTRIGQDMVAAGRTMAQNGATIPYFRRLRQAEDATKLTRGAAAFIDWSHLGWAADKLGDTVKAGAAGAPISGAFGYVASGGDLSAAAESAGAGAAYGIGGGAYGQWEAYTDPRFRYEELLANRRQFRDTLSARDVGGASQLQIFDQLDAGDQLAIATYAQGKPDVAFRFINDRNQASGYYDRDNNVVVINRASKTPVGDIFRHEVAHFVERHGLQAQVREMYLGDAEKGVIGQYTALDRLGNPVFVESTDPDGTTRYGYKLNEAGEKLKAEYESKIRAVDPTFKMSDEYLASELFAEQYADRMLGGGFRRDLSRNAVDNIVDALAAKPVLKNFLGGIGLLFDQNDNVVGTGVFKELKANEGVRRLISGFTSEVSKGKKSVIEDSPEQHVFTEAELRNPELATKWLQGGGAMRFGPDGKPVYDSKGVPQFLTEKEADALQRDLANELITEIEKHVAANPADADVIQRREIVDVNGVKRTVFTGRRIPAAVIDALEAQKRFNPHQLAHLRAASASVEKHGTGAMIAHFYQAASRKLSGKAYKTVGGRWRRDGVVGFQITKDGNVVLNSVSWEQLAENATKAAKTKLAREVYATAGMPVDTAIMADVKTYLGNLVDGKPGATDIGEARRDFINNLLGIRMAANAEANPLFETTTAPKTILTNLRLDRINRMAPLDYVDVAWGPQQYRQAKANMRPETDGVGEQRPTTYLEYIDSLKQPEDPLNKKLEAMSLDDRIAFRETAQYKKELEEQLKRTENWQAEQTAGLVITPRNGVGSDITLTGERSPTDDFYGTKNGKRVKLSVAEIRYDYLVKGKAADSTSGIQFRPDTRTIGENDEFAVPPSDADAKAALASDKQPKFGLARDLEPGTPVGLRIDIPAFQRTGKYVVSVHEKAKGNTVGRIVGYDTVVTVDNPTFMSNEAGASKIKSGDKNKFPIATVEGSFNSSREIPADINEWTAVGFDPLDHSYFYDKRTDKPVVGGKQAVSVGNSVFVKDPVYGNRSDFQYRPDTPEFKRWSKGLPITDGRDVDTTNLPTSGVFRVFHGTKEDVKEFKAKYSDGMFFTSLNPEFASNWALDRNLDGRQPRNYPAEIEKADRQFEKEYFEKNFPGENAPAEEQDKFWATRPTPTREKGKADAMVYPLWARAEKIFNPAKDYALVEPLLKTLKGYEGIVPKGLHKTPNWVVYENKQVVDLLKEHGYDAMWLQESSLKDAKPETLAVFSNTQLKSVMNRGTYDDSGRISYRPDAERHVEDIRKIDAAGSKEATQVNPAALKYPVNPVEGSVTLVPRWGLVNRNIVGMPRSYGEVHDIITRGVERMIHTVENNPTFAKEAARFYVDMAESSRILSDVVSPGIKGWDHADLSDLMLRYLALGSPRTGVSANATKSSGSAAGYASGFEPGRGLGFASAQLGAKETYNAWAKGEHFNLEAPGIDDKVRSFYINGVSELIEMLQKEGDNASADKLMIRAGRSLHLIADNAVKMTDAERVDIQRHLDGKATVDMWDMAGKGFAWPGFVLRKSERRDASQPFMWSQDKFSKTATMADNAWKTVLKDLDISDPKELRYQQARALKIEGNRDWSQKTWAERIEKPFGPDTEFTYYTQGTEAGLSPGGAGPMYDAQQGIDGLIADRLNEMGYAELFGKEKLKARNAQEILWAQEKLDNPIEANNDLSLFGNTFKSLRDQLQSLQLGQGLSKKSRAFAVLEGMDRAYNEMARQTMPIEVDTKGTTANAKITQDKIAALRTAGDADPVGTVTRAVADGLHDELNDIAIKHNLDVTVDSITVSRGGYTESNAATVAPNMLIRLRGPAAETRGLLDVMSRAMDQDGGNIIRKPTVRELHDPAVKLNTVATFDTRGLSEPQREAFFMDLSSLKDANGNSFLTGFTETTDGMAIGDQFYNGSMTDALVANDAAIKGLLQKHNVQGYRLERLVIDTFFRGTPETEVSKTPFAKDVMNALHRRIQNAQPAARQFPQVTDAGGQIAKRTKAGAAEMETAGKTRKKEIETQLKSLVDAALLRGDLDEATASVLKDAIPSSK